MNGVTLHYVHRSAEQYKQLLTLLCDEKTESITIYSVFKNGRVFKEIEKIVQVQKQISENKKIVFKNHAVFLKKVHLWPALRKTLRQNDFYVELLPEDKFIASPDKLRGSIKRLNKSKIASKIWVKDGDQRAIYNAFEAAGLPVSFAEPTYDEKTVEWFDEWLYCTDAVAVNTFTDIFSAVLLRAKSQNCRYSSCIGKTLCVDAEGKIYFCPLRRDEASYLARQEEIEDLRQLFGAKSMCDLVRRSVERRAVCAKECSGFSACQGACPLKPAQMPQCMHYVKTVRHIHAVLSQIYKENKLAQVNSVARNAILNAVAFNSAF